MSKDFIITIHDASTGETIVREMTDEEIAEYNQRNTEEQPI